MEYRKRYTPKAVEDYITRRDLWDNTDIIPGALVDTYIIHHRIDLVEIFEEANAGEYKRSTHRDLPMEYWRLMLRNA